MTMKTLLAMIAAAVAAACGPLLVAAAPSYDRDVVPILRTYCAGCHNDRDREGELSVERFATLRRGGAESGDPVKSGDAAASVMMRRIASTAGDHMPPDDEPQPSAAEVAVLAAWIAAGAPGPERDESILRTLSVPKLPPHVGPKPVTVISRLRLLPETTGSATAMRLVSAMQPASTPGVPQKVCVVVMPQSPARPLVKAAFAPAAS